MDFVKLTEILCERPTGCLLAINSNYGHACQPGYEHLMKLTKKVCKPKKVPTRSRKPQGDGTCFNSAVEPAIRVNYGGMRAGKIYKMKCFSTTGETQVPGVICPDMSDGHAVFEAFTDYLNALGVGDPNTGLVNPGGIRPPMKIVIRDEQPKMLNYKFMVIRTSPRILINVDALADYFGYLESIKATTSRVLNAAELSRLSSWSEVIMPPYLIKSTKPPTDDLKVSFKFVADGKCPRINIFMRGKVNILGAKTELFAESVYNYFINLFTSNWELLIRVTPKKDDEC